MLQPTVGHEIDTNENEQGGEQMPIPVCLDAQKQENRPEVLQVALGAFLKTARASSKPAQVRDGAENRERTRTEREAPNRFGNTSSSPREMISSSSSPPFIAREEAVWH